MSSIEKIEIIDKIQTRLFRFIDKKFVLYLRSRLTSLLSRVIFHPFSIFALRASASNFNETSG